MISLILLIKSSYLAIMKNQILSKRITIALHILFWLGYGAILYASLSNWIDSTLELWKTLITDIIASSLIAYSNYFWLLPKIFGKKKYGLYLLLSLVLMVLVVLARVHIVGLTHQSQTYTYFIRSVPVIGFYLSSTVVWFIVSLISAQRNEIELRNSQLASELKFLKLQLSPHFLFNTLNNVYSMAYFQDKNTAPAIMKLSELMRHMLYEDQGRFISLFKEITFMENFIELWRLKLDEKPRIEFSYSGIKDRHHVAHLIFLVFLENAFKHGNTIDGSISVSLTVDEDDVLTFKIKNDILKARRTAEEESGVGLSNVKKRLDLIYSGKYKLDVEQGETVYIVNLIIDLK